MRENFLPIHFAMPSTLHKPNHVALILDGNGRWAQTRGWSRGRGHAEGALAVRRTVRAAARLRIPVLTLFAFGSANWARPAAEVESILELLTTFLEREAAALAAANLQCQVIGRRDRLPPRLHAAIQAVEAATADGRGLRLRLAVDYSARHAIAAAAGNALGRWTPGLRPAAPLLAALIEQYLERDAGPVDLLIRAGGERRLSDFLLWECACAELYFTRTPWPEFGARELRRALAAYARRRRTFGHCTRLEHHASAKASA